MAISLKVSNSLQVLLERLCEEMMQEKLSVFQPVYIVTQTDGMNNWLNYQIANKMGIAANIQFMKPNELIQRVYYSAELIKDDATSRETITWYIFQSLTKQEFIETYPSVAKYYVINGNDDGIKRIALAQKLADLFDQYIVYRPAMIREWNNGKCKEDEAWQFYIWNDIKPFIGKNKIELNDELVTELKAPITVDRIRQRFPAVYFFGISLITSYHLQALTEISEVIDISFLMINPAPGAYWFEDRNERHLAFLRKKDKDILPVEGNTLLLNWGKLIQNTFWLLFQNEDVINVYDELDTEEPKGNKLLHLLQHQILNNETDIIKSFTQQMINDDSIKINSCYTTLREVESLYNFIIHLLHDEKEDIMPSQILVIAADIDLYAPYIKAVFESAPTKFYFTIADTSVVSEDGPNAVLDSLLQITEKSFTAENVVRLLDYSFIQAQFKIFDIELIRQAVQAANIRYGIHNDKSDETYLVSWKYGLQRIMYGIALGDEEIYESTIIEESFFPVNVVEGAAREQLISFVHFVTQLISMLEQRSGCKKVGDWVVYVQGIISTFLEAKLDEDDEEKNLLVERLASYGTLTTAFTEEVSFEVFLQNFSTTEVGTTREKKFMAGGITFCSMIPMRSIPFKLVAMLGLNYDAFPRKDHPVSFDLMQLHKKRGDRNVKENDKHLFLETLLSAQEYFYVSYIGQQVTSNAQLPASTMVDELVTYINKRKTDDADTSCIVVQQPLHSHSNKYALGNPQLYQYLGSKAGGKNQFLNGKSSSIAAVEKVDIVQFAKTIIFPIKHYYNNILGIYYQKETLALPDTEDFELDGLQKWNLSKELITKVDFELTEWIDSAKKKGQLPLNNSGAYYAKKIVEELADVRKLFSELTEENSAAPRNFDVKLKDLTLFGEEKLIYGNSFIFICVSTSEWKYLAEAYIHYLFVKSVEEDVDCYFLSKNSTALVKFAEISKQEASERLNELTVIYHLASLKLISFSANLKFDDKVLEKEIDIIYKAAIKNTFENKYFPCNDPYLVKAYESNLFTENELSTFNIYYEQLIRPLNDSLPGYLI